MENLYIKGAKGTFFTPTVSFSAETGECLIAGESYLENTWSFYKPIIAWVEEYCQQTDTPLKFTFQLTYYNTSSSKCFLDIAKILKSFHERGGQLEVFWYYPEDDEDIMEEAEDYQKYLGLTINILPFKP